MSLVTYEHREWPTPSEGASYDASLAAMVEHFASLGWVEALVVCGSYVKGSLVPGWSDLDLVVVYDGNLTTERLERVGLAGPGRANPSVPVGIDLVSAEALRRTRRVVGRPLAMSLELRAYARAAFGTNPFNTIEDLPGDSALIRAESAILVRADANSWLRRRLAGYPSPSRRVFDAAKTLLRIAMFESSPLPKAAYSVADYCAAVRAITPYAETAAALTMAENIREHWGGGAGFRRTESLNSLPLIERVLVHYCERWEPDW